MAVMTFKPILKSVWLALCILLPVGCAGPASQNAYLETGPLTPLTYDLIPQDPSDTALESAITSYLKQTKSPASTRFEYTRVDLNNDHRRDALVMMHGPHSYWCDMNGCNMVVFLADNENFSPVSEIFPVRGPLYVSDHQTNGWKDLIIRVSGQSYAPAKDVALQFDGTQYPRNPFFQPDIKLAHAPENRIRIFP